MPWHTPKKGVLGAGSVPKRGFRCGYSQKGWGVLGASTTKKREKLELVL